MRAWLLAAAVTLPAWAQDGVTLQAVLESVARHPDLVYAEQDLEAARGKQLATQGAFDPTLLAKAGGRPMGYYDQSVVDVGLDWLSPLWGIQLDGGWRLGQGDFASYEGKKETLAGGELRVGLTVPLAKGGFFDAQRAAWRQAEQATEEARAERRRVELELAAAAEAAYWQWRAAAQAVQVAEGLLGLAQEREQALLTKIAEGAAATVDALEYQRSVLSYRSKLASATGKERQAAAKLALYLRDDAGRPRDIAPPADIEAVPRPVDERRVPLEEAVELAWSQRPEAQRWAAAERRAELGLRLARADALPKIEARVGFNADIGASEPESLAKPVLDASVSVAWPTLMRKARGGLVEARAKLDGVRAKAGLVRDKLLAELAGLEAGLTAAEQDLAFVEEMTTVAERLAEAELARFDLGGSDLLLVNLREQAAADARRDRAWRRAEVHALRARWRALLGG